MKEGKNKILGRFLKALIILFVIAIILVGIMFISLKVVYDKKAMPYTGVSFTQALGLYKGIKSEPDAQLFENKITEEQEEEFNNKFIEAMMLNADTTNSDEILKLLINSSNENEGLTKEELIGKMNFDFDKIKNSVQPIVFSLDDINLPVLIIKILNNTNIEQLSKMGVDIKEDVEFLKGKIFSQNGKVKIQLACSLNLRSVLNKNFEKENLKNLPNFLKNFALKKIPRNNYFSLIFSPEESSEAEISFNKIYGDKAKQENLNKMLDTIAKKTGTNIRLQIGDALYQAFDHLKKNVIAQFQDNDNKLTFNIYTVQTLFKSIGMPLEEGKTYQDLENDLKDAIRSISIKNELVPTNEYTQVDLDNFIQNELVGKIGIPKENIDSNKLFSSIKDNTSKINLNKVLNNYPNTDDKFEIADKVFAKVISDYTKKHAQNIELNIESLEAKKEGNKEYFVLYSKIDFGSIILNKLNMVEETAQNKFLKKFINGVFYEDSMLKIEVVLVDSLGLSKTTKNALGEYEVSTTFKYNKDDELAQERIDKIVDLVKKIKKNATISLSYNDVCKYIDTSFKDGINSAGLSNNATLSLENGKICFPNIYSTVLDVLNLSDITKEVLRTTLVKIYNPNSFESEYAAIDYKNDAGLFQDEITDYNLGRLINNKLNNYEEFVSNNTLVMSQLIPKNDPKFIELQNLYPSQGLELKFLNKDILVLKIQSSVTAYISNTKTAEVPEKIYITVISDFRDPNNKIILINDFSQEEQDAFGKINAKLGTSDTLDYNNFIDEINTAYTDKNIKLAFNIGGEDQEVFISLSDALLLKANDPLSKIDSSLPSNKYLDQDLISIVQKKVEHESYGACNVNQGIH